MNVKLILIAVALASVAAPALAGARTAHCMIASADGRYDGPCLFTPTGKGSFSVSAPKARRLVGGTKVISVYPTDPGKAEVSGLTADGINSRWGTATRSKTDKACWVGEDFRICATDRKRRLR